MVIRSRHLQRTALLLAVIGVLLRSAIPVGFMPAFGGDAWRGAWLMPCDGGDHSPMQMAQMGLHHAMPMSGHGGGHAAHDTQECPYAAAAASTLPSTQAYFSTLALGADVTAPASGIIATQRRLRALPPARGPPLLS